jgi:hypothetical protein
VFSTTLSLSFRLFRDLFIHRQNSVKHWAKGRYGFFIHRLSTGED